MSLGADATPQRHHNYSGSHEGNHNNAPRFWVYCGCIVIAAFLFCGFVMLWRRGRRRMAPPRPPRRASSGPKRRIWQDGRWVEMDVPPGQPATVQGIPITGRYTAPPPTPDTYPTYRPTDYAWDTPQGMGPAIGVPVSRMQPPAEGPETEYPNVCVFASRVFEGHRNVVNHAL